MDERIDIHREVRRTLEHDERTALSILPAMAGEILASGDELDVVDLRDALSRAVLAEGPNASVAEAVLAMVRLHTLRHSHDVAF